MIKFHPKISGIFLPFPSFLLKSRVFGNNDQDHLYGFILCGGHDEDFLNLKRPGLSDFFQVGPGNCMTFNCFF